MKTLICLYFFSSAHFAGVPRELPEYRSFSNYDVKKYTRQYERAFDREGIITQKNEYHALTISIYGIMKRIAAYCNRGDATAQRRSEKFIGVDLRRSTFVLNYILQRSQIGLRQRTRCAVASLRRCGLA